MATIRKSLGILLAILVLPTRVQFSPANAQSREIFIPPADTTDLDPVSINPLDPPTNFDLGRVQYREEVVFRIPLENTLSRTLELKTIQVSCGCMVAAPASTSFPPETMTNVYLTLNPDKLGRLHRRMTLVFEHDETPININFQADVIPLFTFTPDILNVSRDDAVATVSIQQNFEREIAVLKDVSVASTVVSVTSKHESLGDGRSSISLSLTKFFESSELQIPVAICVHSVDGSNHEGRLLIRRRDIVRLHPQTLVERERGGQRGITAYLDGDPRLLAMLARKDGLTCEAVDNGFQVEIKSKRFVGDRMLVVELAFTERTDSGSVDLIWSQTSNDLEIGRSSVRLLGNGAGL